MLVSKVTMLCVWVRAGWWWWWYVLVGLWVCWWGFYGGHWVWGWVCWGGVGVFLGCGWVGEWVLDKWHSLYGNYYKHEYSVLKSIWPKSGLSEFWKNTLQLSSALMVEKGSLCEWCIIPFYKFRYYLPPGLWNRAIVCHLKYISTITQEVNICIHHSHTSVKLEFEGEPGTGNKMTQRIT